VDNNSKREAAINSVLSMARKTAGGVGGAKATATYETAKKNYIAAGGTAEGFD
jgi:hypothetical protein